MTDSIIGALRVTLGLDSAAFEDGLKGASEKLSGFGDRIKASGIGAALDEIFDRSRLKLLDTGVEKVGLFGSAFEKLGAIGIATGVGIGAAAVAFEGLSKSLEFADKMGKLAQQVGVPVDELSKLKYAADLSDVSLDSLGGGLTRLTKNMATVAEGGAGPAAAAFQTLGIQVKNADGTLRPAGDVLQQIAGRFAGMQDGATKTALAVSLFGKSGADLIPLLDKGSAGISAMANEAEQLGLVITEKTAAGAEEFNDNMKRLGEVVGGVGLQVAGDLAPALGDITHALVDAAKNTTLMHTVGEALADTLKLIASAAVVAGGALGAMYEEAKGAVQVTNDLLHGNLSAASQHAAAAGAANQQIFSGTASLLQGIWTNHPSTESEAARAGATPVLADPNAAKKAAALQSASDQAIAQASKAELAARIALTGDIQELAKLKAQQVDQETADANQHLQDEVNSQKITQAAADTAIALNNRAAIEKKALIERQRDAELAKQAADQEAQLNGFAQQAAQVQEQLAATTSERVKIEQAALIAQQKVDADQLKASLNEQVASGKITQAYADKVVAEQANTQAAQLELKIRQDAAAVAEHQVLVANSGLQMQEAQLQLLADLSKSTFARNSTEQAILKLKLQELDNERAKIEQDKSIGDEKRDDELREIDLQRQAIQNQIQVNASELTLENALQEAADAMSSFKSAVESHNWGQAFDDLERAIQTAEAAFEKQGAAAGFATIGGSLSSVFPQNTALGQVGSAIGFGAGVAGLGSWAGGGLSSLGGLLSWGAAGGSSLMGSLLSGAGALLSNPVTGIVAGIAMLAASLFGNSKPSNFTAVAQYQGLNGVSYTGDKPNDNTMKLIEGIGSGVLTAEQQLQAMGVTLSKTVSAIEIGQRDPSTIHLSDGTVVHSATGDAAAAADAALKAVLQGATYTNDAEKKLVDSMIAAGDSFDDISTALQTFSTNYQAAQAIQGSLADQILQLTDPQAYDQKQVTDAIAQQKTAAQQAADAGYITADQLTAINAQLDQLQSLQLAQVAAKYATATTDAAAAANELADAQSQAASDVSAAQTALQDAYNAQAQTINATITAYQQLSDSLKSFGATLDAQASASGSPQQTLAATRAAFLAVSASAESGNQTALGQLQSVSQAYLDAAKAAAPDAQSYAQALNQVRAAVSASGVAADVQVSLASQQLDALDAQVQGLITINTSVLTVTAAIQQLQAALGAQSTLNSTAAGAAPSNDNIDVAKYLADNPDLTANWNAGGVMRQLGSNLAQAALNHYLQTGQYEIAAGTRKFATGGSFQIGGFGPTDSKLAQMMVSPGEYVSVTHGDSMGRLADGMDALRADLRAIGAAVATTGSSSLKILKRWDGDGTPATRTVDAA